MVTSRDFERFGRQWTLSSTKAEFGFSRLEGDNFIVPAIEVSRVALGRGRSALGLVMFSRSLLLHPRHGQQATETATVQPAQQDLAGDPKEDRATAIKNIFQIGKIGLKALRSKTAEGYGARVDGYDTRIRFELSRGFHVALPPEAGPIFWRLIVGRWAFWLHK